MKVFISWSGEMSHQIARTLHDWLPYVLQAVKPFISSGDIDKGKRWSEVLAKELQYTAYGIVCLTPYNINSPWIHFESGAISKAIDQSYISPFLFQIGSSEIKGPLSQFKITVYNKSDIYKLVHSINSTLEEEKQLTNEVLKDTFEVWWPKLDDKLKKIMDGQVDETPTGFRWLYPKGNLVRIQSCIPFHSVWIITQRIYHHAFSDEAEGIIQKNLNGGMKYIFIIPFPDPDDVGIKGKIKEYMDKYSAHFFVKQIEKEEFRRLAVSDYIIFNPNCDGEHPRMFLELPVNPRDYWIEVDGEAAINFIARFNDLIPEDRASGQSVGS